MKGYHMKRVHPYEAAKTDNIKIRASCKTTNLSLIIHGKRRNNKLALMSEGIYISFFLRPTTS